MKIDQRHSEVKKLADEFKADGVIYENMKFCEFWSYEKILAHHIFTNELASPPAPSRRNTLSARWASCAPASRHSSNLWRSNRYREASEI